MGFKTSLGFSLALLFCASAAAEEPAQILLDAKTLPLHAQEALVLCTLEGMQQDHSTALADIKAREVLQTPTPGQPEDPLFSSITDMALVLRLTQVDCARKLGIDPQTLPEMKIQ